MSPLHQIRLKTINAARLLYFYHHVFGWKLQQPEFEADGWTIIQGDLQDEAVSGSVVKHPSYGLKQHLSIKVKSLDVCVERVKHCGGKLTSAKAQYLDGGYYAFCQDLDGNLFTIIEKRI